MKRYMEEESYPSRTYKNRMFYENILKENGCEITHFMPASGITEVYNFSKIIIKKVISVRDWGMSPLKTKELYHPQNKNPIKYNFWDYLDAFEKVFLYENPKCKHSWFIKICSEVYKSEFPIWFIMWWETYGTTEEILPEIFKEKYSKWEKVSPKVLEYQDKEFHIKGLYSLIFFTEFSIPYIWRWTPSFGFLEGGVIPCLQRNYMTRFWEKMLKIDPATKTTYGAETMDIIIKKIKLYEERQRKTVDLSFAHTMDKIRSTTMGKTSKRDIINAYLEQMKKDLQNAEDETMSHNSSKTDASMGVTSQNIMQDAQDNEEPTIDDIFESVKHFIEENLITGTDGRGECSRSPIKDKEDN